MYVPGLLFVALWNSVSTPSGCAIVSGIAMAFIQDVRKIAMEV
jgi:hypothetical protein